MDDWCGVRENLMSDENTVALFFSLLVGSILWEIWQFVVFLADIAGLCDICIAGEQVASPKED